MRGSNLDGISFFWWVEGGIPGGRVYVLSGIDTTDEIGTAD